MKNLLAALMCLGLATLPGCGGGGSDDDGASPPPIADPGPGPGPDPNPDPEPDPLPAWVIQPSGTQDDLSRPVAVDENHVWVTSFNNGGVPNGYGQTSLHRSVDGGGSWTNLGVLPTTTEKVRFFDALHGWNYHWFGLQKTSDGGATWTNVLGAPSSGGNPKYFEASFLSATEAWTLRTHFAGEMARTTDGGATWTSLPNAPLGDLCFVTGQTGWISSGNSIFKSTNGGASWSPQFTLPGDNIQLHTIHAVNSSVVWILGFDLDADSPQIILATVNGGDTWTSMVIDESDPIEAVHFVDANTGWAVGNKIHHTTDGGATWTIQEPPPGADTTQFKGVFFLNATTGWVVGENGLILKTTTGGK